jgi:hypothetical protein
MRALKATGSAAFRRGRAYFFGWWDAIEFHTVFLNSVLHRLANLAQCIFNGTGRTPWVTPIVAVFVSSRLAQWESWSTLFADLYYEPQRQAISPTVNVG